jgi:hypothetical protein
MQKIFGVISLAVGVILIFWGYNMSQAVGSKVNNMFTGSPGDKPMLLYIGGAVLALLGVGQLVWKRR